MDFDLEALLTSSGHGTAVPYVYEVLTFLIATVLIVPLVQRLRASPVLGYLFAGAVIGPFGLGVIGDVDGVRTLAELGVVFLLFTIGLELSLERLAAMRRYVFGLGLGQVLLSAGAIGIVVAAMGVGPRAAIVLGLCLALSSTAIVLQVLVERGEIASRMGRVSFGVLLFQDLAVVPLLVIIEAFGEGGEFIGTIAIAMLKAIGVVAAIVLVGRLITRPVFSIIAQGRNPDVFVAASLLAILATAVLTGAAGLSMALGAFLAGILLAETQYRHQVMSDIQPFKGLLLGLFFMSVGMGVDFGQLREETQAILSAVVGIVLIKGGITAALTRMFGLSWQVAARVGLVIGPPGEFAFVAIGAAMAAQVLDRQTGQFFLIVTTLSMALIPLMDLIGRWAAERLSKLALERDDGDRATALDHDFGDLHDHVIIAGFGRVGRTVASFMNDQKVPYLALDLSAARTEQARLLGLPLYYGDASRVDVLAAVGIDRAAAVVLTLDDADTTARAVRAIRMRWPKVPVFVRSRDRKSTEALMEIGATAVVPETFESSLQLAGRLLSELGAPRETVDQLIGRVRGGDYADILDLPEKSALVKPSLRNRDEGE